ncbi:MULTISPECIES: Mor transcription activator family protein [Pseudomonas]|uniref:Transcriptional regulator n=1 Tax=Pseudomonas putida S13.1.2 TaxID=1384061 RepID=A0AAU8RXC4_PSEPU|nr:MULTISPECIES: Mor transcription activator family protein [Pseudomonas]AJQ47934.1 transcriptional regulator [Pseudomonas putida S13.1.2]
MSNGELFASGEIDKLDPEKLLAQMNDAIVLKRWEGTLIEMSSLAEFKLRQVLPDRQDDAASIARAVVLAICETMGGSVVYLPRGNAVRRAQRDAEIFREWREKSQRPDVLGRKFDLASQTIYDIIARQRVLHRQQEPDLFGYEDAPKRLH